MALTITRKTRTILLIILAVLAVGGGGFLIWRVTREETLAPEEGEAAYQCNRCSTNYAYAHAYWDIPKDISQDEIDEKCGGILDCECAVKHFFEETSTQMGGIHYECDPKCDPEIEGNGSGTSWDGYEACIESLDVPPPPSLDYTCARCSRNFIYAYARWNVSEEYKGLCNQAAAEGLWATNKEGSSKPTYTCNCDCVVYEDLSTYDEIVARGGTLSEVGVWIDSSRSYAQCIEYCNSLKTETYTLTYSGGAYGTIQGDPVQSVKHGENGTPVTAVPRNSSTHRFTRWSDGITSNPRTDKNVTEDISVTAQFTRIQLNETVTCGNGVCERGENAQNCPEDCSANCGDGYCTHDENAQTCPEDCSANCGDGLCTGDETPLTCPADCPANCGDGYCTHDENAQTCPEDCSANCGDGYCTHDENAQTCPEDCSANCGDGLCTGDETPLTCPADCESVCGDGYCTAGENYDNCPEDCGTGVITEGSVPQTGIFDNVVNRIILGVIFILLGLNWGTVTDTALKFNYSRKEYLSNRRMKRFERKVVKDK